MLHKLKKIANKKVINKQALKGVLFKNNKAVATDSFKMIELDYNTDELPEDGVLISADVFKAGDRVVQKYGQTVLQRQDGSELVAPVIEDHYPDVDQIKPAEERAGETITVNRQYLIDLLEAMSANDDPHDRVELKVETERKDVAMVVRNKTAYGLIMPVKS